MDIEIIVVIIMAALLLIWVVFCVCAMLQRMRNNAARSGLNAQIQCEKCGGTFEIPWNQAMGVSMKKTRSITKPRVENGVIVHKPVYKSYAKKFHCTHCGKKTFGQVLNLEEIQESLWLAIKKEVCRGFVKMVVGGLAILIVMQIPMHFADRAKEKKLEQMREQQFEDIQERYWNH